MQKPRCFLVLVLTILLMSDGMSAVAQTPLEKQPESNSSDDRYDTPTNRQEGNSSSYDRYETPANRPEDNSSASYGRYETPANRPEDNSSSDDRYDSPVNRPGGNSSSYDRYGAPTNRQEDNPSSYDRYETPANRPGGSSSSYDHYQSPTNQPGRSSGPINPLDLLNRLGDRLGQPPAQTNRSTTVDRNQNKEVCVETGDIADSGGGLLDMMTGQGAQPEIVRVAAEPVDKSVIDNINNLEKRAEEAKKENFVPIATQAETLANSLAATESQIPEAAKSFDIAYQTRSRFVPPLDPSLLNSAMGLASSALGGDNFESAIKWYQQSLDVLEKWAPKDPSEKDALLANCLGGMAASYLRQGDSKTALPYAKRLYELVKSKYGVQSAQTCWGAATLGECFRLSGADDQLKPLQDEMFDICLAKGGESKHFGSIHPRAGRNDISDALVPFVQEVRSPVILCSMIEVPEAFKGDMFDMGATNVSGVTSLAMVSDDLLNGLKQSFSQEVPIRFWFPTATVPRGVFVCVHGMCLHSGSYNAMAGALQARGFLVIALDVRGCGTWKNSFGQNFLNLDGCLADIRRIIERVHLFLPNTPIFLLGESMGGGIALHASARHPEHLAGVISSVPGASRFEQQKETIMVILHLPFGVNRPLDIGKNLLSKATRSPQLREVWKTDPLSRKMLSPKELIAFQLFMSQNEMNAAKIKSKPVLVIQGMDDHLVKPPSTIKLYSRIPSSNKTLLRVNAGEHLTFEMNQCSPVVLEHVVDWVTKNSK